jgi:sarcosine oxidase gamma subunit
MDDAHNPYVDIQADGVDARLDRRARVAALRYLDKEGDFARQCQNVIGIALPEPLQALSVPGAPLGQECILAWRNPTQTLLLLSDASAYATLLSELKPTADGCCVDQSGGLWVLRAKGARVQELLLRMGSSAAVPPVGQAHVSRIAELPVMTLLVKPGEFLMLIDRAYAEHLINWTQVIVREFGVASKKS